MEMPQWILSLCESGQRLQRYCVCEIKWLGVSELSLLLLLSSLPPTRHLNECTTADLHMYRDASMISELEWVGAVVRKIWLLQNLGAWMDGWMDGCRPFYSSPSEVLDWQVKQIYQEWSLNEPLISEIYQEWLNGNYFGFWFKITSIGYNHKLNNAQMIQTQLSYFKAFIMSKKYIFHIMEITHLLSFWAYVIMST